MRFHLNQKAVAYAATTLGASLMNSVFSFYYVKVFINFYHVDEKWFHAAQTIFMIWNAINDPLFGYMQDNMSCSWVKSRRHSILYGAPLYALSFLVPWFSWSSYIPSSIISGMHLLFALCFYDTLLTFVLLAQCALFAELSKSHKDRLTLVRYSQIASLVGSSSVFFCDFISGSLQNMANFQVVCVIIAILACCCMSYTGLYAETEYDVQVESLGKRGEEKSSFNRSALSSIWQQTRQIMKQSSFVSFVLTNFCQIFHGTFLSNFTGIFYDHLVPKDYMPAAYRSLFFGAMFITPQILVICGTSLLSKLGYFTVIRASFVAKVVLASLLYVIGPDPAFISFFFLIDSAMNGASFSLFNLCLSDVIDEDLSAHGRVYPLSSMVFGLNALITKPAQSLAPMLVVAILNRYGYKEHLHVTASPKPDEVLVESPVMLSNAMFSLTCTIPVVVGAIQLLVWSFYRIRSSHTALPKHVET